MRRGGCGLIEEYLYAKRDGVKMYPGRCGLHRVGVIHVEGGGGKEK